MLPKPPGLRCALPVRRSEHSEGVHGRCLLWATRMGFAPDARALNKIKQIQVDEIAARTYPTATPELLQLFADILTWFFVSDDQYDERKLGASPQKMAKICGNFVRILETGNPRLAISPLGRGLLDLRERLVQRASAAWFPQFCSSMELYFQGCLQESQNRQNGVTPEFDEYRQIRRASVGTYPCFDLFELAMVEGCTKALYEQPALAALRDLATDVVAWINDIVSFQKEVSFNDPHNMISVLMNECGLTQPEAGAKTVELINEQLDGFVDLAGKARTALGPAGSEYIDGLENWIRGVYDWSFTSARYSLDYVELSQQATHLLTNEDA